VGLNALLAAAEGHFLELLGEVEAELLELVFVAVELDVHKESGGIFGGNRRKKIRPGADFKGTVRLSVRAADRHVGRSLDISRAAVILMIGLRCAREMSRLRST
jgi:hypothetical protein